jgi:hypothetical protein
MLFLSFCVLYGCFYDPPAIGDTRLKIVNSSEKDIYYYLSVDSNLLILESNLNGKKDNDIRSFFPVEKILKAEIKTIKGVQNWNGFINVNSKDSIIYCYFFDSDTIKTRGWLFVLKNRKFISNHKYSVGELEKINWQIVFH